MQSAAATRPVIAQPEAGESNSARPRWVWLVSVGLAAVLLYFALRGVDWRRVWSIISACRAGYLIAACCFGVLAYLVRAWRWRVLLNAEERLAFTIVFWASSAGYLGNSFLPARAGELVRTAIISSRSRLSRTFVFTTAMSERVADLLVLVMIGSSVGLVLGHKPMWLGRVAAIAAALALGGIVLLIALPRIEQAALAVIGRIGVDGRWQERLERMVAGAAAAMRGFRNPARLSQFFILSILIWLLDGTGAVVLARALGMQLSLPVALLLLTGLGVGSALPSTPGAVGIVQFVAVTILVPFHFTQTDAIAFILVAQTAGYLIITFLGLIGIWQYRLSAAQQRA